MVKNISGEYEREYWLSGTKILGVDEVGRGCIAGPVVVCAAVLNPEALKSLPDSERYLIRDSKTLSAKQRSESERIIKSVALDYQIAEGSLKEIEDLGILQATLLAMKRAVLKIKAEFDLVLVDGNQKIPQLPFPQKTVVGGDGLCFSIAAASVMAKNYRDHLMAQESSVFPHYGFDEHVGYGTKKHIEAIHAYGPCALHRKTFAPIKDFFKSL